LKTLKLLFALFFLLGIVSCKKLKYDTVNIKATVFDNSTQQYVPNLKISLKEREQDRQFIQGAPNYTFRIMKEAFTNADGQVDFGEVELRKNGHYDYYLFTDYSQNPIDKKKDNTIQIIVDGIVYINVLFSPPPPYNVGDSLSVKITNAGVGGFHRIVTNTNYNTSHLNLWFSSGYKYINIDKFKSGIYTNTVDTVFYAAFGNYDYTVNW
jgi:hypothetical protein